MRIYAFDIDNTLIVENTLLLECPCRHPDFNSIEDSMLQAIRKGDAVWIVTANWIYTKACMQKLFRSDELFRSLQFFNGYDIAPYVGLPQKLPFVWDIHFAGLKGRFIFRKMIEMDLQKPFLLQRKELLECILYDDTQIQITNMNKLDEELRHVRPWIRLSGVHVLDFLQKPHGNFLSLKLNLDVNTKLRLDTFYRESNPIVPKTIPSPVDIRMRKAPV